MKDFVDVHDAHCCKKHCCKYGDDDCTVVNGPNEGIRCEDCYSEPEIEDISLAVGSFSWSWLGKKSPNDKGTVTFTKNANGNFEIIAPGIDREMLRYVMIAFVDQIVSKGKINE